MYRTLRTLVASVVAFVAALVVGTPASAVLRHQYLFNSGDGTQILDSVGTAHGTALNGGFADTLVSTADSRLTLDGVDDFGDLPAMDIAVNTFSEVSLEAWFVQTGNVNQFTFLAGFGGQGDPGAGEDPNLGYDYLMLQPTRAPGGEGSRGAISLGTFNQEAGVTDGARDLNDGQLHHVVLTVDATSVAWYVDGAQIGTSTLEVDDLAGGTTTVSLADVSNDAAWLGRALYINDPYLEGSIFEFSVWDNALDATTVADRFAAGCIDSCGEPLRFEVDRDTRIGTFTNDLSAESIVAYWVTSASGALDPAGWNSVAATGDADNGGSIDPNDNWTEGDFDPNNMGDPRVIGTTFLGETDPLGGGGPDDGFSVGADVGLGALWTASPFEDLVMNITTFDGITESTFAIPVNFVGEGDPIQRADFNADGVLDAADYAILEANHLTDLTATTAYDAYLLGDMDGDLDNDFNDFRAFKDAYIAANGAAAFAALTVPEPTGLILLGSACVLIAARRRA